MVFFLFFLEYAGETIPDTDMMVDLRPYYVSFDKERVCCAKAPAFVSFRLVLYYCVDSGDSSN